MPDTSKLAARDGIMHRLKPWFVFVLVLGVSLLGRAQHTTTVFTQIVGQATPAPALTSSLNPSTYGQTVTLQVALPSDATGTAQFLDGVTALGGAVGLVSGNGAIQISTLTTGTHSITVQYSGDSNYTSAVSTVLSQVVNQATPGQGGVAPVTIASSNNPSTYGQPIVLTSTVPTAATGTIVFMDGSTSLGTATIVSGTAQITVATLTAGSHSLTATYSGDTNFTSAVSSTLTQSVTQAPTIAELSAAPLTAPVGTSIAFSGLVDTGGFVPTGTVTLMDGASNIGSMTFTAATATNLLSYSADFTKWTIAEAGVTAPQLTAVNANGPDGSAMTASTLVLPDTTALGASASISLGMSSGNYAGKPVVFSVWLNGPAGQTLTLNLTDEPASAASATAPCTLTGQWQRCTLVAQFPAGAGTGVHAYVLSSGQSPASVQIWGAQVEQAPAVGPYVATNGASAAGQGVTVSMSTSNLAVGTHTLTAVYGGDSNFNGSTSLPVVVVITQVTPTITLASTPNPSTFGQSVTFTATLAGSDTVPSGTVTFKDGAQTLGTGTLTNGIATFSTSSLSVGTHSITAVYGGDTNNAAETSTVDDQVVAKAAASIAVASSNNPSTYGQAVSLSVTVTGTGATPSGTVTVSDGATTIGTITLDASGKGALSTSALTAGSHNLTFTYGGDANFTEGSGTLTQRVVPAATTLQLASSQNPSVAGDTIQVTATVAPSVATGSVTFTVSQNGSPVQSHSAALSNGVATTPITGLAAGSYQLQAAYSGDASYAPSTSTTLVQVVNAAPAVGSPDFTLTLVNRASDVTSGTAWSNGIIVQGIDGFSGNVTLSCTSGLDSTMKCSFSPANVAAGSQSQLTISTIGRTVTVVSGIGLPCLLALMGFTKRRKYLAIALMLVSLGGALALNGCGTSNRFVQQDGTPPGTYNITVVGTSGALTHSVTVQVVVK